MKIIQKYIEYWKICFQFIIGATNAPKRISFGVNDKKVCSPTYKHFKSKFEAFDTCRSQPGCKYVLDNDCTHPNDNGHVFHLCGKDAQILVSNQSCIYDKRWTGIFNQYCILI